MQVPHYFFVITYNIGHTEVVYCFTEIFSELNLLLIMAT